MLRQFDDSRPVQNATKPVYGYGAETRFSKITIKGEKINNDTAAVLPEYEINTFH